MNIGPFRINGDIRDIARCLAAAYAQLTRMAKNLGRKYGGTVSRILSTFSLNHLAVLANLGRCSVCLKN